MELKIAISIIVVSVSNVLSTPSYSQVARVSLDLKDKSLEKVMDEIERQTDFYFIFNQKQIDINRVVDIEVDNKLITDILPELFKGTNVNFAVFDKKILLTTDRLEKSTLAQAKINELQQKKINGTVTDKNGPIPGVNVVVTGTTQGTMTDINGKYNIEVPPGSKTLTFTFIGMQPQEISIGALTQINVIMAESAIGLDEVVVIGYGSVKKSDLTGSVSSIKVDKLQETPITSIDQGLVGRAAGVMVTQTSGMPGAIASIRVRGTSSLQGGNEPLYVIDGFPIYNGSGFGNTGGNTQYSGLSSINPSDIESIEILKDASATSIYGSRAANGVILITTKSGQKATDLITFEASYGVQSLAKKIHVMNALEFANLVNEAYTNDGLVPFFDAATMQQITQNPKGTDWQDELMRPAPTQNYELTFSGGDQKMTYAVSANYYDQGGIIRSTDFKRYSIRVNLERKMLSNFRLGSHINLSNTISNTAPTDVGGQSGVVTSALKFSPVLPVFANEEFKQYTLCNNTGIPFANPVATADEMINKNQTVRFLGNIFGEWEIIPDLKAKVSLGADLFNTKFDTFTPSTIYESGGISSATILGGYNTNILNENTLSWDKRINENQNISLLGGITLQKNHSEDVSGSSQNFVNDILKENSLQSGAVYDQPTSSNTDWSLLSYLFRTNYNIKERYLFSFNSRVDGSSRFGKNNKYGFFPSGSFAWRLIQEDFIKDLRLFSDLKLRVSYGITGNQEIGLYQSLPTLTNTTYTFGRTLITGFYPNLIPNPNLKWEKTSQFDAGLDLGFWKNRLRFTTDFYYKKTTDLIYDVTIPFVSGFGTSLQNMGIVENKGLELAIESDNFTGDFRWTTSFNISFNKNKVLALGSETYKDVGIGDDHLKTGSIHRLIVGEPIGLFYGYVFDGIFQNQSELDAGPKSPTNWIGGRRYVDLNGDGVIDATHDRTIIGNPNPKFFGGITNTFSYKGFELNLFLQYTYGNDIFNYGDMDMEMPSGGQNVYADLVNRWTPTNPSNVYPKATTNRSAVFSSAYMEDGSYLKVKTLSLAYMFPNLSAKHISDVKLYVSGQNLLTFTKYKGYDPEVSYRGATNLELGEDFGGYPQSRTIMMGVKLNIK